MVIIRGSDVSTTKFNGSGTVIQDGDEAEAAGSGSRLSSEERYTGSNNRGDNNRGIDDDQYPGE